MRSESLEHELEDYALRNNQLSDKNMYLSELVSECTNKNQYLDKLKNELQEKLESYSVLSSQSSQRE